MREVRDLRHDDDKLCVGYIKGLIHIYFLKGLDLLILYPLLLNGFFYLAAEVGYIISVLTK